MSDGRAFFAVACKDFNHLLRAGYVLRLFYVDYISESSIKVTLFEETRINNRVVEIDIAEAWNSADTYYFVILTETQPFVDAMLYIFNGTCTGSD